MVNEFLKLASYRQELKELLNGLHNTLSKGWCQNNFAVKDANGNVTGYCLLGGIDRLNCSVQDMNTIIYLVLEANNIKSVVQFNDTHTKEEVLNAVKKTISFLDELGTR